MGNKNIKNMNTFTVDELNEVLKGLVEHEFNHPIMVIGEVIDASDSINGIQYFQLRGNKGFKKSNISCLMFGGISDKIIKEYESHEVMVTGKATVYSVTGRCQIQVTDIIEYGEGHLKKEIEKIRLKLEKQGLFLNKRKFPQYPGSIGIISSSDSDAVHDVCSRLKQRFPISDLIIYHSRVQGEYAANNIIQQIKRCNKDSQIDILMIVRGGGSLEDLMAFNDENLARAMYESRIPIITGIGHQPDITIADYVADYSAETPTAAAEYISVDQNELMQRLHTYDEQIKSSTQLSLSKQNENLMTKIIEIERYNPKRIIDTLIIKNDEFVKDFKKYIKNKIDLYKSTKNLHLSRLVQSKKVIESTMKEKKRNYKDIHNRLSISMERNYQEKLTYLKNTYTSLMTYNPKEMLKKGYSILRRNDGKVLKSKLELEKVQIFNAELQDGRINIEKIKTKK